MRRKLPPLTRRQVERLSPRQREEHADWQADQLREPLSASQTRRARQLALSLLQLGENAEAAEHQLLRWRYHPRTAREAAEWAWVRHCDALSAADR